MTIQLRTLDPDHDYKRVVALTTLVNAPEQATVDELRAWDRRRPPQTLLERLVAVDAQGQVVGYSYATHGPLLPPGLFGITVVVDPVRHNQGIGTRLYDRALMFVQRHRAEQVQVEVRDNQPASVHFAEQRGFEVNRHIFESVLDLATFDERPFADVIAAAERGGLQFFSFADLDDDEAARRKLYELARIATLDVPGQPDPLPPFDEFQQFHFATPRYQPAGQIMVADGERWLGIVAMGVINESMYNIFTGVDRAYRGRQLALALKLLGMRYARHVGATSIRTNNDSENAPMLAINRKLGYRPEPGFYRMLKLMDQTLYE